VIAVGLVPAACATGPPINDDAAHRSAFVAEVRTAYPPFSTVADASLLEVGRETCGELARGHSARDVGRKVSELTQGRFPSEGLAAIVASATAELCPTLRGNGTTALGSR
jgi:hypothetical protein